MSDEESRRLDVSEEAVEGDGDGDGMLFWEQLDNGGLLYFFLQGDNTAYSSA